MNDSAHVIIYWTEWFVLRPFLAVITTIIALQFSKNLTPAFQRNLISLVFAVLLLLPLSLPIQPFITLPILPTPAIPQSVEHWVVPFAPLLPYAETIAIILLSIGAMGIVIHITQLFTDLYALAVSSRKAPLFTPIEQIKEIADLQKKLGLNRLITVKTDLTIKSPQVWGVIRPVLLLPPSFPNWPEQERTLVLKHEITHICSYDWIRLLAARLATGLFWYIPGIKFLYKVLCLQTELACDKSALINQDDKTLYARILLRLAKKACQRPVLSFIGSTTLAKRIQWIISRQSEICTKVRQLPVTLLLLSFLLPLMTFDLSHRPQSPLALPTGIEITVMAPEQSGDSTLQKPNASLLIVEPVPKKGIRSATVMASGFILPTYDMDIISFNNETHPFNVQPQPNIKTRRR